MNWQLPTRVPTIGRGDRQSRPVKALLPVPEGIGIGTSYIYPLMPMPIACRTCFMHLHPKN
jgi:hypothetical protein